MTLPIARRSPAARTSLWTATTSGSFLLVAGGAALWGTDPLFRFGLALTLPAPTIVLAEQVIPLLFVGHLVWRGLRTATATFRAQDWLAVVLVGAGASALATLMFTQAFVYGSPTTPVLLQQLQPLFAVAGARLLLGERLHQRYWAFLVAALLGAFLVAFPDPAQLSVSGGLAAVLSVSAACLWGLGTVMGRRLAALLPFPELTALRLFFGALAAGAVVAITGTAHVYGHLNPRSALSLVLLALVPGLLSLLIYYRGLRGTPAASATLGELAFPLTAVLVAYVALHSALSGSQWLGVFLLTGTITAMGVIRSRGTLAGVESPPAPWAEASAPTSA